jgi:hypothetical protein
MASDFFNPNMELFVDRRVDWKRYFHYRNPDADVAGEAETYKMILRTLGSVGTSRRARRSTGTKRRNSGAERSWSHSTSPKAIASSPMLGSSVSR